MKATTHASPATRSASSGFTLLELLIVVALLGILAAVAIPTVGDNGSKAKESALQADLNLLRQAIDRYYLQHDLVYPGQSGWAGLVSDLTTNSFRDGTPGGPYGPYVRVGMPENPINETSTGKIAASLPAGPSGPEGWVYVPSTGEIRANNAGTAPSGTLYWEL